MNKKERFVKAYSYLRGEGIINTQQDVADAMQASRSNVSMAMRGDEKVLTEKFLIRFAAAYPGAFNINWLLTGEGDMLANQKNETVQPIDHSSLVNALLAAKDETIESQRRELEKSDKLIKSLMQQNADLRARIFQLEQGDVLKQISTKQIVSEKKSDGERAHI